ncbi:MAG TPA: carboxypeptidase regulatory-like domain-containing protein, partial [Puia sp.]|nr:carboxypeptidase regulatory-like domain-containing protein [Puia sp.]
MKILLRCYLSGSLLILISAAAFSQDSTRKLLPAVPADTAGPTTRNSPDTVTQKRSKDSIPVTIKDSAHQKPGVSSADSTNVHTGDSVRHAVRKTLSAAGSTGFSGSRRNSNGRQSPAIGHFYGRIVDAKTNKGMDGTSVQLVMALNDTATHNRRDSVVRGAITPSNGDFSFENLPILGSYHLKLTAIGYKPVDQRVAFNLKDAQSVDPEQRLGAVDKDLGNIKMEIDPTSLQQVTVTADKPLIQLGIDRKVYNVEKDLSAAGGNAVDIMKNIPSLAVDIDG